MAKINKAAPFLRCGETARMRRGDMLVALLPAVIIAVMQTGLRALFLSAVSAFAAWLVESVWLFVFRRKLAGIAPITMGLLIALICPVSVPWWLPAAASGAGVLLVRLPFEGMARPPFQPMAFMWLLLCLLFPAWMNVFPAIGSDNILPVFGSPGTFEEGASISYMLGIQSRPHYSLSELLVGNLPGPMGVTSLFVIAACAVYLIYRRAIAWQAAAGMTGVCVLLGLLVDRSHAGAGWSVLYELSAAGFLFAAVYVAADTASIPRLPEARLLYGVLCGCLAMIFRYLGMDSGGLPAAILLSQVISLPFDRVVLYMRQGEKRDFYRLHRLYFRRLRQRQDTGMEQESGRED